MRRPVTVNSIWQTNFGQSERSSRCEKNGRDCFHFRFSVSNSVRRRKSSSGEERYSRYQRCFRRYSPQWCPNVSLGFLRRAVSRRKAERREKKARRKLSSARAVRACIICSFRRSRSARRCSRHPCRRVRCSRREWRLCPSLSPFSWRRRLRERIPGRE